MSNTDKILLDIEKLGKDDQLKILKYLENSMKIQNTAKSSVRVSQISGLGSAIWKNVNIEEYVDQQREW